MRRLSALVLCLASFAAAANIPRNAPEFAIFTTDGRQILTSQFHGKPVVLLFMLTSCPHCQHTIGILSKLQPEYASRGVQVLACAIDDMAKMTVPDFIKKFQPPFPLGYSPRNSAYEYLQHPVMLLFHVPAVVFIDRRGMIRAQWQGDSAFFAAEVQEKNFRDSIEQIIQDGAGAGKVPPHKAGAVQANK